MPCKEKMLLQGINLQDQHDFASGLTDEKKADLAGNMNHGC